ncbi:MAG TPA: STAS domain-containing protein [Streptosporangiaceae bacterium]|jgi:anti-anti-sigma factor|nr:STAS domain-containing protein [Streptosporangiaceae bacterium]
MTESRYPIQLVRGVPVIAAPVTLDLRAAGLLRTTLLHLAAAGHVTVVIDMSATMGCDAAGRAELARAYEHAAAEGGDLRLVAGSRSLSDVLAGSGLDRVVGQFPTVAAAVAETPAIRIVPFGRGPRSRPPRRSGSRQLPAPLPVR